MPNGRSHLVVACLLIASVALPLALAGKPSSGPSELAAPATVLPGDSYVIANAFRSGSPTVVDLAPSATAPASAIARLVMVVSPTEVLEVQLGQKIKSPTRGASLAVNVAESAPLGSSLRFTITAGSSSLVSGSTLIQAP